ncbi:MAG: hypothetical protein OEY94_03870 [Alphaproteobacteria bacterium]|nr:hypothetical protein [Alphaproteobacteria bacterium]
MHQQIRQNTNNNFDNDLSAFHSWMINDFLGPHIVPAVAAMLSQLNAVGMQYVEAVGMFMDARLQLETQRLNQKLKYEAHRDYTPSDDFCWFGTNVRSLVGSETRADYNALGLSRLSLDRYIGAFGVSGDSDADADLSGRWELFVKTNCDRYDNNNLGKNVAGVNIRTGLEYACDRNRNYNASDNDIGAVEAKHINRDIDFTRLVDEPRTIDVDFTDATLDSTDTISIFTAQNEDEIDVIQMQKNLYGHRLPRRVVSRQAAAKGTTQKAYIGIRNVHAKRNVAEASFNAIIGLKSSGSGMKHNLVSGGGPEDEVFQTQRYMAAIIREILPDDTGSLASLGSKIYELIGFNPSYYSQLEVLAKRIYQNPDFYAYLYDKPANVARKKVAMRAVELMVDREIYESQLRREMLVSVLLSSKLMPEYVKVNEFLTEATGTK